jgi:AraC-like DNA-binding protein
MFEVGAVETVHKGEVVALLARSTPAEGANAAPWPGLTFYRFEKLIPLHWDSVGSLSLCLVAQGRKRVRIGSTDHFYDPFHYLVMSRGLRFQAEILRASPVMPFLSFVLQVPAGVAADIVSQLHRRSASLFPADRRPRNPSAYVTPIDQQMLEAVLRFLRALDDETERSVLAPMYLREIVYRLLHAEQRQRLIREAVGGVSRNPVTTAIEYMRRNLDQPLTVGDLADAACLSTSAFAHLFSETVGVSPYQFLRDLRLDAARSLLLREGVSVTEVAPRVGYSSLSHFINEFKRRYGETPRAYVESLQGLPTFSVAESTSG